MNVLNLQSILVFASFLFHFARAQLHPSKIHYITPTTTVSSTTTVNLALTFEETDYILSFTPNKELYSTNYKETQDLGTVVLTHPPLYHCHYHLSLGELPNHPTVHGAISLCDDKKEQPRGLLSFSGTLVALEPFALLPKQIQQEGQRRRRRTTTRGKEAKEEREEPLLHTHALIRLSDMPNSPLTHVHADLAQSNHNNNRKRARKLNANTKWVEMLVVNDRRRFDAKGAETQKESAAIVNAINNLYENAKFDPPIRIILSAQHTFTATQDPWENKLSDPANVDTLIKEFHEWRSGAVLSQVLPAHDNGQLFSSREFEGATVGYAGVGTMCLPASSGGIDQMTFAVAYNAGVVGHEMGHNFDMSHDSGGCANGHVMSGTAASSSPPTTWSSCSATTIKEFFTNKPQQLQCLNNKPTSQWGAAQCGNGFVEKGEECDPIGADSCCNAKTCMFVTGAVCSDADGSQCCQNCQFVSEWYFCCTRVFCCVGCVKRDSSVFCSCVVGTCGS